jgi:2-oxoglutarate ferredoxin oxidoreductase subunit alpha
MEEISILIGGEAGDGIKQAGNMVARLLNRYGYRVFVYEDYQSLIRGGHNFAIVRASKEKVEEHKERVDVIVALNQETVEKHRKRLKEGGYFIVDSDKAGVHDTVNSIEIPMTTIARERNLPLIVRNTIALGALARALSMDFLVVEDVIRKCIRKKVEENVEACKEGYNASREVFKVEKIEREPLPLLTGNELIALGLVKGGMKVYIAYPMTPASSILHFLAANEDRLNIRTVHPETEIAVIGMLQGCAYAGVRAACGTSGGGFALMVEHLSLAGQAEIPTVIVLAQRPAPATGVPTYTMQGDLFFAMFSGHGEFPRVVMAPGNGEQAFYMSAEAMNIAWKFQIPVIVLSDKQLSESTYSVEIDENLVKVEEPLLWNGEGEYKRYEFTENGISPLAFPGEKNAVVKANSYEHDEFGITVEEEEKVERGYEKRLRKMKAVEEYVNSKEDAVDVIEGDESTVLVTWGSTRNAVFEVARKLGLKAVQVKYLYPLPRKVLEKELKNAGKIVCVEVNSTGLLASWLEYNGIKVADRILKYNARPFAVDELERIVRERL